MNQFNTVLALLVLVALLQWSSYVSSGSVSSKEQYQLHRESIKASLLSTTVAVTLVECCAQCNYNALCGGVTWEKTTRSCSFYKQSIAGYDIWMIYQRAVADVHSTGPSLMTSPSIAATITQVTSPAITTPLTTTAIKTTSTASATQKPVTISPIVESTGGCFFFNVTSMKDIPGVIELEKLSQICCFCFCRSHGFMYSISQPPKCFCLNDPYKVVRTPSTACPGAANSSIGELMKYDMLRDACNTLIYPPGSLFTASDSYGTHQASKAFYYEPASGWITTTPGSYIQINFDYPTATAGVWTYRLDNLNLWTTRYFFKYNQGNDIWNTVYHIFANGSRSHLFDGNNNSSYQYKVSSFDPLLVRQFRIYPLEANNQSYVGAMKVGFYAGNLFRGVHCLNSSFIVNSTPIYMGYSNEENDTRSCPNNCSSHGYRVIHLRKFSNYSHACFCSNGFNIAHNSLDKSCFYSLLTSLPEHHEIGEFVFETLCLMPLKNLSATGPNGTAAGNWFGEMGQRLQQTESLLSLNGTKLFIEIVFDQNNNRRRILTGLTAVGSETANEGVTKFSVWYQVIEDVWHYIGGTFEMPDNTRGSTAVPHWFILPNEVLFSRLRINILEFTTYPVFQYTIYGCRDIYGED